MLSWMRAAKQKPKPQSDTAAQRPEKPADDDLLDQEMAFLNRVLVDACRGAPNR